MKATGRFSQLVIIGADPDGNPVEKSADVEVEYNYHLDTDLEDFNITSCCIEGVEVWDALSPVAQTIIEERAGEIAAEELACSVHHRVEVLR